MWKFFEAAASIIDKLTPGRKEAYHDELNQLILDYDRNLKAGNDTKAAVIRKRMSLVRQKLGLSDV